MQYLQKKSLLINLLVMLTLAFPAWAGTHTKIINLETPTDGVQKFDLDCGAGMLIIKGGHSTNKIMVEAEIEVEGIDSDDLEDFIKDRVKLTLNRSGNRVTLHSDVNNDSWRWRRARINLMVRVPDNIDLDVRDGSGSIEISDIKGSLRIDDGSGSMDINRVSGDMTIDDGSGSIELREVDGNLDIEDGSGSMSLRNVTGNITVRDGSGSITINQVGGDVNIRESGSGGLSIRNVKGSVHKDD